MIRSSPSVYVSGALRGLRTLPRRADGPLAFLQVFGRRLGATGVNPIALNALAQAIQTQEGYAPGTLAYQNNNPGNLVYVGQAGATPGAGGFAAFSSYQAGYQALENQIQLDATRGTDVNGNPVGTVGQLITSWAPPSQNDTAAYISSVTSQTGFGANDPLSSLGSPSSSSPSIAVTDFENYSVDDSSDSSSSFDSSSLIWILAGALAVIAIGKVL